MPCNGAATMGASFWAFYDLNVHPCTGPKSSSCPGALNDNYIVSVGTGSKPASDTQVSQHIHFRRFYLNADWKDLSSGTNSVATAFSRWTVLQTSH